MGKISNSINHYLSDNRRFADLFNGICFQGEAVIHAEDLMETSQVYQGTTGEAGKTGSRKERIRDVCKLLKSGETLRVLALENQEMIDYAMPFRCMQYDVMEYGKQLDALRKKNRQESQLKTIAERICGVKRTDRIVPISWYRAVGWPQVSWGYDGLWRQKGCFPEDFKGLSFAVVLLERNAGFAGVPHGGGNAVSGIAVSRKQSRIKTTFGGERQISAIRRGHLRDDVSDAGTAFYLEGTGKIYGEE